MRAMFWHLFAWSAWTIQPLCLWVRQVSALLCPLFALSSLAQSATMVAGTKIDGSRLASIRLVGVGIASHYFGGHDRRVR